MTIKPPPTLFIPLNRDPKRAIEHTISALRTIIERHPEVRQDFDCESFIHHELSPALEALTITRPEAPSAIPADIVGVLDALHRETTPGPWETRFWTGGGGKTIAVPSGYLVPAENCLSSADICFIVEVHERWPQIKAALLHSPPLARGEP